MTRVYLAAILTVLFAWPAEVHAQGFSSFNGRNHPELSWQVAETEHFKIAYPEHLEGVEDHAAAIAEESYKVLSANLGVTFDSKIRIYLSDEDENVNGFAVPIGAGHTNIWINVNDVAVTWTGSEKWLRKVIPHELAHIFHYKAIRSNVHPFNFAFSNPIPSFWTEGLAQYQTETWDAFRGEQTLRTAVLDDQLSFNDGRSINNGRLRYAVGNSQLRFFAEQYGDSTLANLLRHRETALFGLVKYHHFPSAFAQVTDEPYRTFYERWRRHVNIRYNTLAGTMENGDSLGTDALTIPGQYVYGISYSADGTQRAMVSLLSLHRPIRQLVITQSDGTSKVLTEGSIRGAVSWSPDAKSILFARNARDANGSLINDLHLVSTDGSGSRQLTNGRRAAEPAFSPDGKSIAFVGASGETGNVFLLNPESLAERQLTNFSGDVQLGAIDWHPTQDVIALSVFSADGQRTIHIVNAETGTTSPITGGLFDDRGPVWSPDGSALAYTSLRDGVPNIFICQIDLSGNTPACATNRRVTNLVTGAIAMDWLEPDSTDTVSDSTDETVANSGIVASSQNAVSATGAIVAQVTTSKTRDEVYLVAADRQPYMAEVDLPSAFESWTTHRPPMTVPTPIRPDPTLVQSRKRYRALANLTHVASIVSPYISTSRYGIGGITIWSEPLAKHMGYFGIGVDARAPLNESGVLFGYINNTLRPSIETEVQFLPDSPRPYGRELLLERLAKVSVQPIWQLNTTQPYHGKSVGVKLEFLHVEPRNADDLTGIEEGLPYPESGEQVSVQLSYSHRFQRPWVDNLVHPLDGSGVRARVTGAAQGFGNDQKYVRIDLSAYRVLPSIAMHRILLHGRVQLQRGESLAQDFIGLSRYDVFQISAPTVINFQSSNSERVRGFRDFVLGNAVFFGTIEYRIPLTRSLDTQLLGLIGFGSTSVSLFADGALVSNSTDLNNTTRKLGVGIELKNAITLGGIVTFMHAVGIAQQSTALGTDEDWEIYYRVRKTLPF